MIIIDGKPGVGKTTLGRFLAWRFNISLIETDLFSLQNPNRYNYNNEAVRTVINYRQELSKRPVIVEGVVALRLLDDLNICADFHIHVTCKEATATLREEYSGYVEKFQPKRKADIVLELPVISRFT